MDKALFSKQWALYLLARFSHSFSWEKYHIQHGRKIKLSPITPSEDPITGMSRKPSTVPSTVPPIPSTPVCDSLSQPSSESRIPEVIKSSPEKDFIDLQPSQRHISSPANKFYQGEVREFISNKKKISQVGWWQDLKLEKMLAMIPVLWCMELKGEIILNTQE